jgi:microcystin-dependent protein
MAVPYIGQIIMFAGDFAPVNWALCQGQLLDITPTTRELFNQIGTAYGGDGKTKFGLPDLRARVPIHYSATYPLAKPGGAAQAAPLTLAAIPSHSHAFYADSRNAFDSIPVPNKSMLGVMVAIDEPEARNLSIYATSSAPTTPLSPSSIQPSGQLQPQTHENRQPFQVVNYIIAVTGNLPPPPPP